MDFLRDYTQIEPYPIGKMSCHNPENTICELLRRTYQLTDNHSVRLNLRIAITMAKKMGDKLNFYRKESKKWKHQE